ncbi:MAG: hypothetical protein WCJ55_09950 [Chloroflexales bacterium]
MSQLQLCQTDPLVALIYDLFGANMVRVPDSRIRPLSVIAQRAGHSSFRGSLLPLLTDAQALGVLPATSELTDITGRRSRRVTLDLGMHILRGFLKGFGLPSAGLASKLGDAACLSFAFPAVRRVAYDISALGWALAGRRIDRLNPAAAIVFDQPRYELLLIDSILTSSQISVIISNDGGQRLNADASALGKIFVDMGAEVSASGDSGVELALKSPQDLTFAFTCVRLFFDQDGLITAMPPDSRLHTLGVAAESAAQVRYSPDRVLLNDRPGLLSWDR